MGTAMTRRPVAKGRSSIDGFPAYIRRVNHEPLPYSLESLAFPFPALAALAGRLPLGGGREVALAAMLVARLAHGLHGPRSP